MISLKKKSQAVAAGYNWRPDFRDAAALPDVRAVRARFFLPTVFISISTLFVAFIAVREYQAASLNDGIASLAAELESAAASHDQVVDLNGKFRNSANVFEEIEAFSSEQISGSELLLRMSSNAPQGLYLTQLQYGDEGGATIQGRITVQAEEASAVVNSYIEALKAADATQGQYKDYSLQAMSRDGASGSMDFRIGISNDDEAGKKKR